MEEPIFLNDRYKLTERLGEGGMAEVYRGQDLRLGRDVAVKMLRPQYAGDQTFLQRFLGEARSLAGFSHPNIVNVYDVGKDGRRYYIVMEYVPGSDLRQILQKRSRLPVKQALNIARQVALGVGYAHRKGLVHRDIKPGNVLITPGGEAKVADFGIAKAMSSANLTEPGVVWGTTAYLSPEQVRGEPATPASDVYSIGVVLYEVLAGRVPFTGEDRVAIALQHLHDTPAALTELNPRVPRGVEFLVQKALAKNPADRYPNADDLARALGEYLRAGTDLTAPREALPARAPATAVAAAPATLQRRPPAPVVGRADDLARQRERRAARLEGGNAVALQAPESRIDWATLALAIVAAVLVFGLVPLYMAVYAHITGEPLPFLAGPVREIAFLFKPFLL
ncbi:MAG: protein kinase [Ardenticatenaceae bacterium]|nr:protein kinase [Ardenticatenaceae bacterium]